MSDAFTSLRAFLDEPGADLSKWSFYKPVRITPDGKPAVVLNDLQAMADYALAGACDPITAEELAVRVVAAIDLIAHSDHGKFPPSPDGKSRVFDAPLALGVGGVARKERTVIEMRDLLDDPNLGHDARNQFEAALGLPLTPRAKAAPTQLRVGEHVATQIVGPTFDAAFRLPRVWTIDDQEVGYDEFAAIHQFPDGTTVLSWSKDKAHLPLTRIMTGNGFEIPAVTGMLAPGAQLTICLGQPNKVMAAGALMRNGRVVRDGEVDPVVAEADRELEENLRKQTIAEIKTRVGDGSATRDPDSLKAILVFVMQQGYHRATAEGMIADVFEALDA